MMCLLLNNLILKKRLNKEFNEELRKINETYKRKNEEIMTYYSQQLEKQKKFYDNENAKLKDQIKNIETENIKYRKQIEENDERKIIASILENNFEKNDIFKEVIRIRNEFEIESKDQIKAVICEMMTKGIEMINQKKDISDLFVIEYILCKMMEVL